MQYSELKDRAVKILIKNAWPFGFAGQIPNDAKELFIDMADEICCLKARVDELEKKIARAHFSQMPDIGETES